MNINDDNKGPDKCLTNEQFDIGKQKYEKINKIIQSNDFYQITQLIEKYLNENSIQGIDKATYVLNNNGLKNVYFNQYLLEKILKYIQEKGIKIDIITYAMLITFELNLKYEIGDYEYYKINGNKIISLIKNLLQYIELEPDTNENSIKYLCCLIINYSIFDNIYNKSDFIISYFSKLIKILEKNNKFLNYLFYVYTHLIYYMFKSGNKNTALINSYIKKCDKISCINNFKINNPYVYVIYELIKIEYKLSNSINNVNINDFGHLNNIINKYFFPNSVYIYIYKLLGLFFISQRNNSTKKNIIDTIDEGNSTNQYNTEKIKENLYKSIEFAKNSDNGILSIEAIIELIKIEKDEIVKEDLFFKGREILEKHFNKDIAKTKIGKLFIKIGKKYILKKMPLKVTGNSLGISLYLLDLKYREYVNSKDIKSFEKLVEINGGNNAKKLVFELLKNKFNKIRLYIYNLTSKNEFLNYGFKNTKPLIDKFCITKEHRNEINISSNDIKNGLFSLTLMSKKKYLGKNVFIIIVDKTENNNDQFTEKELCFIQSLIEKLLLNCLSSKGQKQN